MRPEAVESVGVRSAGCARQCTRTTEIYREGSLSSSAKFHRSIGLQSIDKAPLFRSAKRASDGLSSPSAATTPQGVTGAPWAVPERPGPFQNAPGRSRTRWPFQNALAVPGRASRPRPRQRVAERMRRPRPPQAVPARTGRPSTGQARPRTPWASQNAPGHPRTPRPPQNATPPSRCGGCPGTRRGVLWWEPVQNAALRARPRGPSQNAPLRTGTRLWPP